MSKIHYTRFPVTSPPTGKLPTCYTLVMALSFMLQSGCGLVTGKSPTCYGETGVKDFGL